MEEINEELHEKIMNFNTERRLEWMRERKPYSVLFEITPKCNFQCIHCYLQNSHQEPVLSYSQITYIIDILCDKGILFLTLTGGEILSRPDFLDIYLYAKKKGFFVELFTNGYLFTEEIIAVLEEYPPLLIDISLYGANEDTYKKITNIEGGFERVISNCRKLKAAGIRVSLRSPIMTYTLKQIEDMNGIAVGMDIPFVYTFEMCPTIDKKMIPREYQVKILEVLKNEFRNYEELVIDGERSQDEDFSEKIDTLKKCKYVYSCNVARNSFVIDYKGNMLPCMKLRHRGVSLFQNDFDKIWEGFEVYSNYIATDHYKCKNCESRYFCDICPAEMDFIYGDMEYRPETVCRCAEFRKQFYRKERTMQEILVLADS